MVIVVICVNMGVEERRAHRAALNGERETECERAAHHSRRYCLSESRVGRLKSS